MNSRFLSTACCALLALLAILAQVPARAALPQLELQLELDPGTRRLDAVALFEAPAREFRFELHETLEVRSASLNGKRLKVLAIERVGTLRRWSVALPTVGGKLRLEYGGTLPPLDRSLDQRGVLQALPPMAASEGSFLPSGGAWYPRPAARFAYKVSVSLPAAQRALVPGQLLYEQVPTELGGRYRAGFAFLHAASGIDLMAGPWLVREQNMARASGGPVRLRTYLTAELDAIAGLAAGYLDDTRRYIELYSAQIGAYPFSEFSIVASPLPTGFGMATLTYIGADVLKLPFIRASSLGHEVLHNWWGNGVAIDDASGNWSEGLTTFMADYAYKERQSEGAARQMRIAWLRDYAAMPLSSEQPLAEFRSRAHGAAAALGYGKSAMLFLMLRDEIGADAFQRAVRLFWGQHRFQVASWDDLRQAFEQASGRQLNLFFAQWLNRVGAPEVKIASASTSYQGGKIRLALALEQRAPAYALRLPLEIVYADHSETRWIDSERNQNVVTLAVAAAPEGVRLDPDVRVWRRLERTQLAPILRQWVAATAPRVLIVSPTVAVHEAANALGLRLFENAPRTIASDELRLGHEPVLLVGLRADVDAALAKAGLPAMPASLAAQAGAGTAQVWTVEHALGPPLAVIAASDAIALNALLRPLPHYGAQSWLLFNGSHLLASGVWPMPGPLVTVHSGQ